MSERQRETTFLRQCLGYDDAPERHQLEARIIELQRKERIVQRAVWLMTLLITLAVVGLCYWAIFVADHPRNMSEFITPFISKGFCEVGLGALICLLSFLGLGVIYRRQLARRREECRRMATKLMESRMGPTGTFPSAPAANQPPVKTNKTNRETTS